MQKNEVKRSFSYNLVYEQIEPSWLCTSWGVCQSMQPETDGHTAGSPGTGIFRPRDQIQLIDQRTGFGGLDGEISKSRVSLGQHDLPIL